MQDGQYIRIHKEVETYVEYYYQFKTKTIVYEFYFTSIANCARWLGVSYNAVKFCLRGDYKLCDHSGRARALPALIQSRSICSERDS